MIYVFSAKDELLNLESPKKDGGNNENDKEKDILYKNTNENNSKNSTFHVDNRQILTPPGYKKKTYNKNGI